MVATVGSLAVRLQADNQNLARGLQASGRDISGFERRSNRSFQRMDRQARTSFTSMGRHATGFSRALMAGALGATGGLLSLAGAIQGARRALADYDRVAKAARNSGLDSDLYQALAHGADLAGVQVGELDQALQRFRRSAAEAAQGKGELHGRLKTLNPELLGAINNARNMDERLQAVADAIKNAKDETEQINIATAAFGRNGQRLIPMLAQGADGLNAMTQEARNLGLVIDRDVLKSAEEMTDQLSIATRIMDAEFKRALISLAPILVSTARLAANVAGGIRGIVDAMRSLSSKSRQGLEESLRFHQRNLAAAQERRSQVPGFLQGTFDLQIERSQENIDAILDELRHRAIEELRQKLTERQLTINLDDDIEDGDAGGSGRAAGRNAAAEAALREAQSVLDLTRELETELALVGATEQEMRSYEVSKRIASAATDEQRQYIIALNEELHNQRAALEEDKEAQEFLTTEAYGAFESIIMGASSAEDALKKLAMAIARAALQAAILGTGPLSGLFGGGSGGACLEFISHGSAEDEPRLLAAA